MTRRVRLASGLVVLAAGALCGGLLWLHFRGVPRVSGRVAVRGASGQIELVRDRWGVPHIFAASDADAYFGLGFAVAQDRLFQLDLLRHVGQGRLAELFGRDVVDVDRLFRAMDFHGIGVRRLERARPEVRAAFAAYAAGVNAAVDSGSAGRPVELTLLGRDFAPVRADEFVGVLGYLAWTLQISWRSDPLYEKLVARVGAERAAALFPASGQPETSVFAREARAWPLATLFDLSPGGRALMDGLPRLAASNTWAVGPQRSATGHALLANDPHLDIGLPSTWYHAHMKTPTLDVAGATIPGLPVVVIGHNDQIAWGLTNLMLDAGDFFVERTRGEPPAEVQHRGVWEKLATREETLRIKGAAPVTMTIRVGPHGPLVSDLVPGRHESLSFLWSYAAAEDTNDCDAFFDLNRARDFSGFRAAVARMGGVAQNISYADRAGHIGLVATGAIPLRLGQTDGRRFRRGWDGSEEWGGFVPPEQHPFLIDPREGYVAAANNPTFDANSPYYISSYWDPSDRYVRIREFLRDRPRVTLGDMRALQRDVVWVSARSLLPLIQEAYANRITSDARLRAALGLLARWDGRMEAQSAAAALFASFYRHLFHEVFDDELGVELANDYCTDANLQALMIEHVLGSAEPSWFDRVDTPTREDRADALRRALEAAVADLSGRLGPDPAGWFWGRVHTLELTHPLGRVRALAPYFNLGPVPMPGHALTVFKEEARGADDKIVMGPSLRHVVDLGDLSHAEVVLPGGQSGVPASRHYGDLFEMWRSGTYHPLLTNQGEIEAASEGRLILTPIMPATSH
jgi:penicillin G amidase